jgi:hypothetical protein
VPVAVIGSDTQADDRESQQAVRIAYAITLSSFKRNMNRHAVFQATLLAAVLLPLLLAAIAVSIWNWNHIGGADLDQAGYVALAIGVVATLGLGTGLMGLVFYSNHHNYDDDAKGS